MYKKRTISSSHSHSSLYPENLERLRRVEKIAEKYDETVPEIAVRYIFSNDLNLYAVISTTRPERLDSSITAAMMPLSEDDIIWIENG